MREKSVNWVKSLSAVLMISLCLTSVSFAENKGNSLENQLKDALLQAQTKLGELEPWQKQLYTDEVLPQYQRFIRDYRSSGSGLQVEIDHDSLKRYLMFYAPKALKQNDPKILVLLKTDITCAKCVEGQPGIQSLVKARLEKRGLTPVWLSSDDFSAHLSATGIEDQMASLAKQRKSAGFVVVQWAPAPIDDIDTAHADEKRYVLQSFLRVGESSIKNHQKELLDTDSFEMAEGRLLTDIFTDLGAKIEWEQLNLAETGKEEVFIEISGIRDFGQYNRIRNEIQSKLKDVVLEDRKLSREQIVFAIFTKKRPEDLKQEMGALNLDAGGGQLLTVVVR
jgi:hypothetical protein